MALVVAVFDEDHGIFCPIVASRDRLVVDGVLDSLQSSFEASREIAADLDRQFFRDEAIRLLDRLQEQRRGDR